MMKVRQVVRSRRVEVRQLASRSREVVLLSAVVGLLTGGFVALFDKAVVEGGVDHVLELSPWLIAVLPGAGLLVAMVVRRLLGRGTGSASADEYLLEFHDPDHHLSGRAASARLLASLVTLGTGNPMGMEGPSLFAGAMIGSKLQRRFPRLFRASDRRVLLVAGAAAGVAAIFKAPATGAVFALEVPYKDDLARRMLLPALVSSATGYLVFALINGPDALFPVTGATELSMRDVLGSIGVGVIAGLGARLFSAMLRTAKDLAARPKPLWVTVGAGVVLALLFTAGYHLTGQPLAVTSGYNVIHWASDPSHSLAALLAMLALRSLGTSASLAGGGVGGLFIPLVVGGALSGAVIANIVGRQDITLFVVIGIAAFLGAGYRVPLASVMFVAETTGRPAFIVPGLLAAVAAELMMGQASVTKYQRATS